MSTTTANLALVKPDYSDVADISVLNGDLDTIDAHIHSLETAVGIPYSNANTLSSRVGTLEDSVNRIDNQIGVSSDTIRRVYLALRSNGTFFIRVHPVSGDTVTFNFSLNSFFRYNESRSERQGYINYDGQ